MPYSKRLHDKYESLFSPENFDQMSKMFFNMMEFNIMLRESQFQLKIRNNYMKEKKSDGDFK